MTSQRGQDVKLAVDQVFSMRHGSGVVVSIGYLRRNARIRSEQARKKYATLLMASVLASVNIAVMT